MASDDSVVIPLRKMDTGQPWGFKVDGGADVGKPLYIVQVSPKSVAGKAGLRDGDAILGIGKCDVSRYTQAQLKAEMNRAGVDFLITLKRNAVSIGTRTQAPPDPDTGVVDETSIQMNDDDEPFQEVSSESTKKIAQQLQASERDSGPRPASVFDRRKQDRSSYQTTTGVSYNRAFGRPM